MAPEVKQHKLPPTLVEWEHVSVTWEDAYKSEGAHNARRFIAEWKPCIRRTAGYVIHYTDTHIFLATEDDRDSTAEEDGQPLDCEALTVIPLAYVRRITRKK